LRIVKARKMPSLTKIQESGMMGLERIKMGGMDKSGTQAIKTRIRVSFVDEPKKG
jgi:hypothetical protein